MSQTAADKAHNEAMSVSPTTFRRPVRPKRQEEQRGSAAQGRAREGSQSGPSARRLYECWLKPASCPNCAKPNAACNFRNNGTRHPLQIEARQSEPSNLRGQAPLAIPSVRSATDTPTQRQTWCSEGCRRHRPWKSMPMMAIMAKRPLASSEEHHCQQRPGSHHPSIQSQDTKDRDHRQDQWDGSW